MHQVIESQGLGKRYMDELETDILKSYKDDQDAHRVNNTDNKDAFFFGHGKLLLTGEYFVLDGAQSIALPTSLGQSMKVSYSPSFSPKLYWKSFDVKGHLWLEGVFEFWHFEVVGEQTPELKVLGNILQQARKQNPHFLRDNVDVHVETNLGFPLDWGLGSSSTLIYNIAQWAYISPFELLFKTMGGSGYDIACAQSSGPILYKKNTSGPHWSPTVFNPSFKENLYFVYLGKKQNSREGISFYQENKTEVTEVSHKLTQITQSILECNNFDDFELLISGHEKVISESLGMPVVKDKLFNDFWGQVKSLGAWGGDFVLVTSHKDKEQTKKYFDEKGYEVFIPYSELVLCDSEEKERESSSQGPSSEQQIH